MVNLLMCYLLLPMNLLILHQIDIIILNNKYRIK